MQKLKYAGIADANGIESFMREPPAHTMNMLIERAKANRHREAVAYKVELTDEQAKIVEKLCKSSDNDTALAKLQSMTRGKVTFPKEFFSGWVESWKKIPNPKLDLYGGSS